MTAKEIREEFSGFDNPTNNVLGEIAAQLAELNETCRKFQMSRPKFWADAKPYDLSHYPRRDS